MGGEPTTEGTGRNGPWPVLDVLERRVLGVMVEKAKTTPDAYPLSINALVSGCNQKSNREFMQAIHKRSFSHKAKIVPR